MEMSLDRILGVIGAIGVPAAIGAGLAMDTKTPGELRFAQACFAISALVLMVFTSVWGITSDADLIRRILTVMTLFAFAGAGLIESVRWSQARHDTREDRVLPAMNASPTQTAANQSQEKVIPADGLTSPGSKRSQVLHASRQEVLTSNAVPSVTGLLRGRDNTSVNDSRSIIGDGNTIVGATDDKGNAMLNGGGTAIGNGARADSTSVAIGAHAIAGNSIPPKPTDEAFLSIWRSRYAINELTLLDLYNLDFEGSQKSGGHERLKTPSGAEVLLSWFAVIDLERGSDLLEFYIPYTTETYGISGFLADKSGYFLTQAHLIGMAQKMPGDSTQITSGTTVFSKRVFIYHETFLEPEQVVSLQKKYEGLGLSLILRSSDYLDNQKMRRRLKLLESSE